RTWRATDACGNTAECSQTVTVEDHTPPTIACVPNKTVECGSAWTFDAPTASDACGNVTITILNTITNTTGHCGNTFDATRTWLATDDCGNRATCQQTVTVFSGQPPVITSQPLSQTLPCGSDATFSVTSTGTGPLAYQWRCNETNLAGATSSSLTFSGLQLTNAGLYDVVVSNPLGAVTSATAVLTVMPQPTSQAPVALGSATTF